MVFSLKKAIKTPITGHALAVCKVKIAFSGDFFVIISAKRNKLLAYAPSYRPLHILVKNEHLMQNI
jgi:hypothetical protein